MLAMGTTLSLEVHTLACCVEAAQPRVLFTDGAISVSSCWIVASFPVAIGTPVEPALTSPLTLYPKHSSKQMQSHPPDLQFTKNVELTACQLKLKPLLSLSNVA